jgi:hypothetical protein
VTLTNEGIVDLALDRYVARMAKKGIDPTGVQVRTLAALVKRSPGAFSHLMQQYRRAQSKHTTRYVVGCQGYGRAGRWTILAKPGDDPTVVREARRSQALWISHDMANRFVRDVAREIQPGLKNSEVDKVIRQVLPLVTGQLATVVEHVERVLTNAP